jgi:hypothetical protein
MSQEDYYLKVPKWENGVWTHRIFETKQGFQQFIASIIKEPGEYAFDETAELFNATARTFERTKKYSETLKGTGDYSAYWDKEKERCRVGVIFQKEDKVWYLDKDYYFWINFLQIWDKMKKRYRFPEVWDTHYHLALCELDAELQGLHISLIKKRQIGSSFFHAAKLIRGIWFEEGFIGKMGASLAKHINKEGTWKFLDQYRNFLNKNTAWYRPFEPKEYPLWEQKIETERETATGKQKVTVGLMGKLQGTSLEKDPANGVGGACSIFFYEEGGIAPTADQTKIYMDNALKMGEISTGQFIIAGSVGDLEQCAPLKKFIYQAKANGFYTRPNKYIDSKGLVIDTGLFIPEQWSMPPYIDDYGNSKVKEALKALEQTFEKWKKEKTPEDYQLAISQSPRTLEEAFAARKDSIFPSYLCLAQQKRIDNKEYPTEYINLRRSMDGTAIECVPSNKIPISEFPLAKNAPDKEGVIVCHERPDKNASWGQYYATIDPVKDGKTTTSPSLCAIYIMKNAVEVTKDTEEGPITYIEPEKLVAYWCGRFDDPDKNHERCELMIEWYNAWTLCENNVSDFVNYMIKKRKQRFLVRKDDMLFLKDIGSNKNVYQEYGWRNTGRIFADHMLNYGVKYLKEVIDQVVDKDGNILKTVYGVERIPDIMLLKEMLNYQDGLNVDRLVAFCALVTFIKIQQANRGYVKRYDAGDGKDIHKSGKITKLAHSPFRHIGQDANKNGPSKPNRNPFRHIR